MKWFGAAFLLLPLVEIALFVVVGSRIGLWPTLAVVIGSGILGVGILRRMGGVGSSLSVVRGDLLSPLAERTLLAVAALLLILPGFLTDTLGLVLLLPFVRRLIVAQLGLRLRQAGAGPGAGRRADETVIDGEFYEIEPETRELRPPSGWTRH